MAWFDWVYCVYLITNPLSAFEHKFPIDKSATRTVMDSQSYSEMRRSKQLELEIRVSSQGQMRNK